MDENKLTTTQEEISAARPYRPTPGHLIRGLVSFQFRLILDGTRDLLLSPVSVVATLLDLLGPESRRGQYFQMLCFWGHKSDRWINLFGLPEEDVLSAGESTQELVSSADKLIEKIEKTIRDGLLHPEKSSTVKANVKKMLKEYLE
jgi:hypothetical protein